MATSSPSSEVLGAISPENPQEFDDPSRLPEGSFDGALRRVQRLAEAYLTSLRRRHPGATPAEILHVVNQQFLLAMALGGAGTGLASLRARKTLPLLGLSAAHMGASGTIAAFYLFVRANLYGLGPAETRNLIATCSFGENPGGILEQQAAGTWWRSALAYLPASQVHFVKGVSDRALRRPARKGRLSPSAKALPAGIGTTVGLSSGRVLGNRVIDAASMRMGPAPLAFD